MTQTRTPLPGQIVRVRQRQYLVEGVTPPYTPEDSSLVRLSCLDDDAQGQPLEVLWDKEIDPEILTGEAWEKLAERGFDPPRLFAAYLHTVRWNCVTATDPYLFQAPFRAGIRIDAYQLEPLRKALLLPRVNLFIADDVGLGKTIEAGLIVRELLMRKKVRDIVVACPPSMLYQWQEELENRFGLTFAILDKSYVATVRQERGFGVNPWSTHSRFLVSQRLLIDEAYTAPLRDWLGELRPGALLLLDEAHHAAPASGAKYAIDSKITRAIRDISPRFEHRLFLSATPHNGHSNSFSALLEILDPQRFCRGVPVRGRKLLDDVMVRRIKEDVRSIEGGFPKRVVEQIDISGLPGNSPELVLPELLDQYRKLREERLKSETRRKQASAALLVTGLQQRLLSSVEAFARTLAVHRRTIQRQIEEGEKPAGKHKVALEDQLDLLQGGIGNDDPRAELSEEEQRAEEDAQIAQATMAAYLSPSSKELELLDRMATIAEDSRGVPDAKVRKLIEWIRSNMCPLGPAAKWNTTRIIVFTEWDDTRRYLHEQLQSAIHGTDRADDRIEIFHGPTPPFRREEIKRAFTSDPKKHPVRILIATDAAREGLNLQTHCWNMFHFDVPWNPSRLEQRNGRIDRKLQPNLEVFCRYFFYAQRVEDKILKTLVRKTETIKEQLGSLSQVLESRITDALKYGIRREATDRIEREIESADMEKDRKRVVEEELEEARERKEALIRQIEQLRKQLDHSNRWIGFTDDHFREAISCSLEIMGANPLKEMAAVTDTPRHFSFPALDQREGADATWADTMDTLRVPRRRDQKPWEWRKDSPVRPVVFKDPGTLVEEFVHLHLEHRVVQRLLGRFIAQGFIHHDLSRACLAQSDDAIPRVVLLGRLCLYGPGAARLHEEIVPVTSRWVDPTTRKGALTPYSREAESKTLDLLEKSLLPNSGQKISDVITSRLQSSAPRDLRELLPELEKRGAILGTEAEERLLKRGQKESAAMVSILEEQKKRISETFRKFEDPQLSLGFDIEEVRQLDSNRRHWEKRLLAIDRELSTEPERIRDLYSIRARRIEPIGLVYLWPVTG